MNGGEKREIRTRPDVVPLWFMDLAIRCSVDQFKGPCLVWAGVTDNCAQINLHTKRMSNEIHGKDSNSRPIARSLEKLKFQRTHKLESNSI